MQAESGGEIREALITMLNVWLAAFAPPGGVCSPWGKCLHLQMLLTITFLASITPYMKGDVREMPRIYA